MAIAEDAPEVTKWLALALLESLALNIELIEMITDCASPELQASPAFKIVLTRVEALKENRRYLMGGGDLQ